MTCLTDDGALPLSRPMHTGAAASGQHGVVVSGSTGAVLDEHYIARGRVLVAAVATTSWALGDYALEAFPMADGHTNTGSMAGLRELAVAIGIEPDALIKYRKVAAAWPEGTRVPSATWTAHRAFVGPAAEADDRKAAMEEALPSIRGMVTEKIAKQLAKGSHEPAPEWFDHEEVPARDDFAGYTSPKVLVNTPRHTRGRVFDALVQVRGIIVARFADAQRPYDVATEGGMRDEIRALAAAMRDGDPNDRRCARLALAATLILLAERDDAPKDAPPEGERARAASRPPLEPI